MSVRVPPPGRAPVWLPFAAMALAVVVLVVQLGITVSETDRALLTFDSAEYAVAGRTTARSSRLATTFVLPHESSAPAQPPFPLILGHPFVPLADALAFRLGGEHAELTLVPPALAFVLLAGAVCGLAGALGAGPGVAFAAVLALVLHPAMLRYASEGLTEIPFALLLLLAALALTGPITRRRALGFGVALGIAHLVRPVMVPLLPAWLAGLALATPRGARLRTLLWALVAFAPFAAGWALAKGLATGDPFADVARYNLLVGLDPRFTPVTVQCSVAPPAPLPWIRAHPQAFLGKLARGLPDMLLGSVVQTGLIAPFVLAGVALGFRRREHRGVAVAVLGSALLLALLVAASLPSRRYLAPLVPLELALGFAALARLARRAGVGAPLVTVLAVALALAVSAYPTLHDWRWALATHQTDRGVFHEREWREAGAAIAMRVPPGALVASDAGAFVAWYADRPAVLIPRRPAELATLETRLPVDALVLTDEWLLAQPGFEEWQDVATGTGTLAGWRVVRPVVAGRLHATVLLRTH